LSPVNKCEWRVQEKEALVELCHMLCTRGIRLKHTWFPLGQPLPFVGIAQVNIYSEYRFIQFLTCYSAYNLLRITPLLYVHAIIYVKKGYLLQVKNKPLCDCKCLHVYAQVVRNEQTVCLFCAASPQQSFQSHSWAPPPLLPGRSDRLMCPHPWKHALKHYSHRLSCI
jgi:hypothetical protein